MQIAAVIQIALLSSLLSSLELSDTQVYEPNIRILHADCSGEQNRVRRPRPCLGLSLYCVPLISGTLVPLEIGPFRRLQIAARHGGYHSLVSRYPCEVALTPLVMQIAEGRRTVCAVFGPALLFFFITLEPRVE